MNQCEYIVNNLAGEVDGLAQKNGTTPNEVLHSRLRSAVPTSGHLSVQTTMFYIKSALLNHNSTILMLWGNNVLPEFPAMSSPGVQ